MSGETRPATAEDLRWLDERMRAAGIMVAPGSLRARIGALDGGIICSVGACLSWALDGGALHLYDFAGELKDIGSILAAANRLGRERFAAVLTTQTYVDDPWTVVLKNAGFLPDCEEGDVRAGKRAQVISLVREVC